MAFFRRQNPLLGFWYKLYTEQTLPERKLELQLAKLGVPYRCQHPFLALKHFADFALTEDKVTIEVDGDSHNKPLQRKKDLETAISLKALGWDVVRMSNEKATVATVDTVRGLLAAPRIALESYQASLRQLLRDYPSLLVPPAKRSKSRRPPKSKAKKASP